MILFSRRGKRERQIRRQSAAALLLSTCLILPYLADAATALQNDGMCPNHLHHDETCGYVEAQPEEPCSHEHDDSCYQIHTHSEECYEILLGPASEDGVGASDTGALPQSESLSGNTETGGEDGKDPAKENPGDTGGQSIGGGEDGKDSVGNGADGASAGTRRLICGHEEDERILDCQHVHDADCGYRPAIEGAPCMHSCELCADTNLVTLDASPGVRDDTELRAALAAGAATLEDDYIVTSPITITADAKLDLNGHIITFAPLPGDQENNLFVVSAGTLTIRDGQFQVGEDETVEVSLPEEITDTSDTGYHGDTEKLIYYTTNERHEVTAKGRLIGDNSQAKVNSLVMLSGDGALHLQSGMLVNPGGVHEIVHVSSSVLKMSGGYLTGANSSGSGGAILGGGSNGGMNLIGGVIVGNSGQGTGGGAVYSGSKVKDIILDGIVITGNKTSKCGGGVYVAETKMLSVLGNTIICRNESGDKAHDCESIGGVCASTEPWNTDGKLNKSALKALENSCDIEGLQKPETGPFHDMLNEALARKGTVEVQLNRNYEGEDNAVLAPYTIPSGVTLTLDLKGHTVEYRGTAQLFSIQEGGKLILRDSQANYIDVADKDIDQDAGSDIDNVADQIVAKIGTVENKQLTYYTTESVADGVRTEETTTKHTLNIDSYGKLISTNENKKADSLVRVKGGEFELESGILANVGGMRNVLCEGGAVTMEGGYIIGGASVAYGGGIRATAGKITVTGGVIAANTAKDGGGISSISPDGVEIGGNAVIAGNTAQNEGGGIQSNALSMYGGLITNNQSNRTVKPV